MHFFYLNLKPNFTPLRNYATPYSTSHFQNLYTILIFIARDKIISNEKIRNVCKGGADMIGLAISIIVLVNLGKR